MSLLCAVAPSASGSLGTGTRPILPGMTLSPIQDLWIDCANLMNGLESVPPGGAPDDVVTCQGLVLGFGLHQGTIHAYQRIEPQSAFALHNILESNS
jgi:hypothetical protein